MQVPKPKLTPPTSTNDANSSVREPVEDASLVQSPPSPTLSKSVSTKTHAHSSIQVFLQDMWAITKAPHQTDVFAHYVSGHRTMGWYALIYLVLSMVFAVILWMQPTPVSSDVTMMDVNTGSMSLTVQLMSTVLSALATLLSFYFFAGVGSLTTKAFLPFGRYLHIMVLASAPMLWFSILAIPLLLVGLDMVLLVAALASCIWSGILYVLLLRSVSPSWKRVIGAITAQTVTGLVIVGIITALMVAVIVSMFASITGGF